MTRPPRVDPATARAYLQSSLQALKQRGGRVISLRLEADELAALDRLTEDGTTMRDAIAAAIRQAASGKSR